MRLAVDIAIAGAGTAGMACAIEAVQAGVRVAVIEQADRIGGALHVSAAQMSGAGAMRQKSRGIADDWRNHFDDVVRICRGTCQADLVELATKLGGSTIDWLEAAGFEFDPTSPAILHFHEAYRTARTFWGVAGGRSVLKVVKPQFDSAMAKPNATLLMNSEVVALCQEKDGEVTGIVVRGKNGDEQTITARHIVLATGGYGGNAERFARWTGGRSLHTAALPTATGAGIELGLSAGGVLRGAEHYLPTFAGIPAQSGGHQILWDQLPSLTPQVRAPWEVFVSSGGERFVREDVDSVDARERALNGLPDALFWAVFDERIWREAPPLLPGWKPDELAAAWESHENFIVAPSLGVLAERIGCERSALDETISVYNAALRSGKPDPMGRVFRPLPIESAPFRAIRMHGMVLKTPSGLTVDRELRVVKADGVPIPGLYAVGEALGGATLSGNAFVGGMSVTPALGFGRWLGARLAGRDLLEVA